MREVRLYDNNLEQAIIDLPYSDKIDTNGEGVFIPESDYGFAEIYRMYDDILVFSKGNSPKFNLDDIRIPQKFYRKINNMRGATPGNVWEFPRVRFLMEEYENHPTQKPEGLIERMILASSDKGDVVLDPFSGSGTTLRVCQQLERNGIGFELNPEYVEMTKNRLAEPFDGFDSLDPRMERVPNDLRKPEIRDAYLANHIDW